MTIVVNGDGRDGKDAHDGRHGAHGTVDRKHGQQGSDASIAHHGQNGKSLSIHLVSAKKKDGSFVVKVNSSADQQKHVVPLKDFGLDWTARGGKGGNGGTGGDGGDGAANGDGGDAGRGSSGRKGGNGGHVQVLLQHRDAFLLMKVAACDQHRLAGGKGGTKGKHGKPGKAGNEVDSSSGDKKRGTDGAPAKGVLRNGMTGSPGTFRIKVHSDGGDTKEYTSRYDLALKAVHEHRFCSSGQKITTLEFGESVLVPEITVANVGKMPTPDQRVSFLISDEGSKNIVVDKSCSLSLKPKTSLASFESGVANRGFLRYTAIKPDFRGLGDDFDPFQMVAQRSFKAFQHGPETKGANGTRRSDFVVEYTAFDLSQRETIRLAYPVENKGGVIGRKNLGMKESTKISFNLRNTSDVGLGARSESKRQLVVQYYLSQDSRYDIPANEVRLFRQRDEQQENALCLDKNVIGKDGFGGHIEKIGDLPAGKSIDLCHTLHFGNKIIPYSQAALQVDIHLEDVPTLLRPNAKPKRSKTTTLVQRRKFVVTCEPTFRDNPRAKAVLVTSCATKRGQCQSWLAILNGQLGLHTEIYSLSIYGHLDPTLDVPLATELKQTTKQLRDLFAGKVVVVLNDPFEALVDKPKVLPASLLTRVSDFHASTRWLFVSGGESKCGLEHLTPVGTSIFSTKKQEDAGSGETTLRNSDSTERTCDPTETETETTNRLLDPADESENEATEELEAEKEEAEDPAGYKLTSKSTDTEASPKEAAVDKGIAKVDDDTITTYNSVDGTNSLLDETESTSERPSNDPPAKSTDAKNETKPESEIKDVYELISLLAAIGSPAPSVAGSSVCSSDNFFRFEEERNVVTLPKDPSGSMVHEELPKDPSGSKVYEEANRASELPVPTESPPKIADEVKQVSKPSSTGVDAPVGSSKKHVGFQNVPPKKSSTVSTVVTESSDSPKELVLKQTPVVKKAQVGKRLKRNKNIKSYKHWLLDALVKARSARNMGVLKPGVNVVTVKSKLLVPPDREKAEGLLRKHADHLQSWLMKHDSVRVYVIEIYPAPRPVKAKEGPITSTWTLGSLLIHRGVALNQNPVVAVQDTSLTLKEKDMAKAPAILYSVLSALDPKIKVRCYADAMRGVRQVAGLTLYTACQVIRDSLVSDFIREVVFLHKSRIEVTNDRLCCATLQRLQAGPSMMKLIDETVVNVDLMVTVQRELSELIARFEVVVHCKDFRPWSPVSRKHSTRKTLIDSLARLKAAWKNVIVEDLVAKRRQAIEAEVTLYMTKSGMHGRWMEGVYQFHSSGNRDRYDGSLVVHRHSGIDSEEQVPILMDSKEFSKIRSTYIRRQKFAEKLGKQVVTMKGRGPVVV